VDDPRHCDFYYPAVVRRGALQIAISTAGQSPALARRLRKELECQISPDYTRWLSHLAEQREQLFSRHISAGRRRRMLQRLAGKRCFEEFVSSHGAAAR
jgi:precorrin-2 dehydrogenase/sirohydrochlorin ferrochelatase